MAKKVFVVEKEPVEFMIGSSSSDIRAKKIIEVK
jgi:hypothetical protein